MNKEKEIQRKDKYRHLLSKRRLKNFIVKR